MPKSREGETMYKTKEKSKGKKTWIETKKEKPLRKTKEEKLKERKKEIMMETAKKAMEEITVLADVMHKPNKELDNETKKKWVKLVKEIKTWAEDNKLPVQNFNEGVKFYYNVVANSPNSREMLNHMEKLLRQNIGQNTLHGLIPVKVVSGEPTAGPSTSDAPTFPPDYHVFQMGNEEYLGISPERMKDQLPPSTVGQTDESDIMDLDTGTDERDVNEMDRYMKTLWI